jgi:hypothetical protein
MDWMVAGSHRGNSGYTVSTRKDLFDWQAIVYEGFYADTGPDGIDSLGGLWRRTWRQPA